MQHNANRDGCVMDVAAERELIESRLADLHRQRGLALLHGRKFDNAAIVKEHEALAALEDLDKAKAEQSRDEVAKARAVEIQKLTADIEHFNESSAKAKAKADRALTEYVGILKLRYQHSDQARKAIGRLNALTGKQQALIDIKALQKQDSMQLLNQLRQLGHPGEFGYVKIPAATKSL